MITMQLYVSPALIHATLAVFLHLIAQPAQQDLIGCLILHMGHVLVLSITMTP